MVLCGMQLLQHFDTLDLNRQVAFVLLPAKDEEAWDPYTCM
jgi:hypothetical protein